MRKGGKFFIGLAAILFSGLCISMASPAKAATDIDEMLEESTDLAEPEVDPEDGIDPAGYINPTFKGC